MNNAPAIALWCLTLSGCALLSKGEVSMRRYFSPDLSVDAPARSDRTTPRASSLELRLGRVTAGDSLDERMMLRTSAQEIFFYDDRLWTEKPETYLRRGLSRVLFEEGGLRSILRGAGPTLDVELISFEEVKAHAHVGRVKISFTLSDERVVSLQETVCVDRPVVVASSETEASAVARAMGEALRDVVAEIAQRVMAELARAPPVVAPGPAP